MSQRLRSNFLSMAISFGGTAVVGVVSFKIITNHMPQDAVGVWAALYAAGALLGTFTELGMPVLIVRYSARFAALDELARLRGLLGLTFMVHLSGVVVMVGLLSLFGSHLGRWLGGDSISPRMLLLAYLALGSATPRALNNAAFRGLRRMAYISFLEILFALMLATGYWTLREQLTPSLLLMVFWVSSVTVSALGLILLLRIMRQLPGDAESSSVSRRSIINEVRGYWGGAAFTGLFIIAIERVDKLAVAAVLSFQGAAILQAVTWLALFPRRLLWVPMQVLFPEFTHKWEQGRGAELEEDITLLVKLMLGLALIIAVPLIALARPALRLISTTEYAEGGMVVGIIMLGMLLLTLYQPLVLLLRAVGHIWYGFVADGVWLVLYLGVGSLLAGRWGLSGFVSGQVVASLVVLSYTLWAFNHLQLPRPSGRFFVGRATLSILIWAPCLWIGTRVTEHTPLWQAALIGMGLLLLLNIVLVLGGLLNRNDEERILNLMTGRGLMGRVVALFFRWPRRLTGGSTVVALLVVAVGTVSCADQLPHGCICDDDIPAGIRQAVEASADTFFAQVRRQDSQALFDGAAQIVRDESDLQRYVTPIATALARYGLPDQLSTSRMNLVHYVRGKAVPEPLPCQSSTNGAQDLFVPEFADQANIVRTGEVDGRRLQFSVHMLKDEDDWRPVGFHCKPAEVADRDWQAYEALADQQFQRRNFRNAALIYNLAIDLCIPNAWTRPEAVIRMEEKQSQILVANLPADRLDVWVDDDGEEYRVYKIQPDYREDLLGMIINHETYDDPADSLYMEYVNRRLFEYVQRTFPEYAQVFDVIYVRAGGTGELKYSGFLSRFLLKEED